jgi:hypothetical protein
VVQRRLTDLHVPETGAQGVIVANADHIGGFALWVDESGILQRLVAHHLLGLGRLEG